MGKGEDVEICSFVAPAKPLVALNGHGRCLLLPPPFPVEGVHTRVICSATV
jgi:hypothetical protein